MGARVCSVLNPMWVPINALECPHAVSPALDFFCTSELGLRSSTFPLPWHLARHAFLSARTSSYADAVYTLRCLSVAFASRPEFEGRNVPTSVWQHILTFTHEFFFEPLDATVPEQGPMDVHDDRWGGVHYHADPYEPCAECAHYTPLPVCNALQNCNLDYSNVGLIPGRGVTAEQLAPSIQCISLTPYICKEHPNMFGDIQLHDC